MSHRNHISSRSLMAMFVIFVGSVIEVQLTTIYVSIGWILVLGVIHSMQSLSRGIRDVSLWSVLYLLGYWLSSWFNFYITDYLNFVDLPREFIIACSRLSLLGFIIPFLLYGQLNKTTTDYMRKGSFNETICFPLIWRGLRNPIWRFLLIGSCIIIISFQFVIDYSSESIYIFLRFGLLFALLNSVLEEVLWRGLILSRFVDVLGEKWGLVVVSFGFGMYHYSIGFPWIVCALFSVFGMLLGGIAIRSKGLLPVIILHFIMNLLFVLSGLIF